MKLARCLIVMQVVAIDPPHSQLPVLMDHSGSLVVRYSLLTLLATVQLWRRISSYRYAIFIGVSNIVHSKELVTHRS
jgi:hypothetical protein